MKIQIILENKLPVYDYNISSWKQWSSLRYIGRYDKTEVDCEYFYCASEKPKLKSLIGAPDKITGNFNCSGNSLETLLGAPRHIGGNFEANKNKLTSLEGLPNHVGGYIDISFNKIKSLKSIHKRIKYIGKGLVLLDNPIKSDILGLLLVSGNLHAVNADGKVFDIINKHLGGDKDVLECQEELISNGFKEYAKL
jgi:hypothetical protein